MLSNRYLWMGASAVVIATAALVWILAPQSTINSRIEPTHRLTAAGFEIKIAIADTSELRARGLSGTTMLSPDEGMLFVFDTDGLHSFWMKEMLIPIDILWTDANSSVVHIEHAVSPDSFPQTFTPPLPARYVLEVPAGFATEHGIEVGSKLEFSL